MRHIQRAGENDLPAMHAILTICGEHMHRNQGMDHWYPFRGFDLFKSEVTEADVYGVYESGLLVGTFYLTPIPRSWYVADIWKNPLAKALYFGGFGILPFMQGQGIGAWVMSQVDEIAVSSYEALRFDGVAYNKPLMHFYEKLGYERRGIIETPRRPVMCFEKVFKKFYFEA